MQRRLNKIDKTKEMTPEKVKEIERALSEKDGSLRDINMDGLDWEDTTKFLDFYTDHYQISSASNSLGDDVTSSCYDRQYGEMFSKSSTLILTGIGKDVLIKDLNASVFKNDKDTYDLELDFKPEQYDFEEFLTFLKPIIECSKKREYFVKYENVSWVYGQLTLDVIFSHHDIPL